MDSSIAREVLHPEIGLPGKYVKLSAYNLNQWLNERAAKRPVRVQVQSFPAPVREPATEDEKQRVREIRDSHREMSKAMEALWNTAWPKIGGNLLPPNLVRCDDGLLRPPVGRYRDCPDAFGD